MTALNHYYESVLVKRYEQSSLCVIQIFDIDHIHSFIDQIQSFADGPALGGISLSVGLATELAAVWVLRPMFPSFGSAL